MFLFAYIASRALFANAEPATPPRARRESNCMLARRSCFYCSIGQSFASFQCKVTAWRVRSRQNTVRQQKSDRRQVTGCLLILSSNRYNYGELCLVRVE